jgi:hypothetical protein
MHGSTEEDVSRSLGIERGFERGVLALWLRRRTKRGSFKLHFEQSAQGA